MGLSLTYWSAQIELPTVLRRKKVDFFKDLLCTSRNTDVAQLKNIKVSSRKYYRKYLRLNISDSSNNIFYTTQRCPFFSLAILGKYQNYPLEENIVKIVFVGKYKYILQDFLYTVVNRRTESTNVNNINITILSFSKK